MPTIHPTAVIDPKANLAPDVQVGPLCFIGPDVTLGRGTRLVSHVVILGPTTLGEHNIVWPHAVLGGDPQDLKYRGEDSRLVIGDHNQIREAVTIHRGTANDQALTKVGSHNLLMAYTHIAHDCMVGDHVILANGVGLAGHVVVEDHASIGAETGVHHFITIGGYAYVGGMSRLVRDVPPYMIVEGNPARVRGVNTIGLSRHGFTPDTVTRLEDAWKRLFKKTSESSGAGHIAAAIVQIESLYNGDPAIARLITSVRHSAAVPHGRYRESLRHDDKRRGPAK